MLNNKTKLVERNYIVSSFIDHGDPESCLKSLLDVCHGLEDGLEDGYVSKMVQIGMDGPNGCLT